MALLRTTAIWTGFPGAPGYTNHYWSSTDELNAATALDAVTRMREFFGAMTLVFPSAVNINVQPTVAVIDPGNGSQTGEYLVAAPAPVVGAGAGTYAGPAGACVTWRTTMYLNGRRLRGRTFLVPLTSAAYEGDGTILASRLADIRTAASALANTVGKNALLTIWNRPDPGGTGGASSSVSAATVNDRVAVLKSRR